MVPELMGYKQQSAMYVELALYWTLCLPGQIKNQSAHGLQKYQNGHAYMTSHHAMSYICMLQIGGELNKVNNSINSAKHE